MYRRVLYIVLHPRSQHKVGIGVFFFFSTTGVERERVRVSFVRSCAARSPGQLKETLEAIHELTFHSSWTNFPCFQMANEKHEDPSDSPDSFFARGDGKFLMVFGERSRSSLLAAPFVFMPGAGFTSTSDQPDVSTLVDRTTPELTDEKEKPGMSMKIKLQR